MEAAGVVMAIPFRIRNCSKPTIRTRWIEGQTRRSASTSAAALQPAFRTGLAAPQHIADECLLDNGGIDPSGKGHKRARIPSRGIIYLMIFAHSSEPSPKCRPLNFRLSQFRVRCD